MGGDVIPTQEIPTQGDTDVRIQRRRDDETKGRMEKGTDGRSGEEAKR